jgi:hypothetical protein
MQKMYSEYRLKGFLNNTAIAIKSHGSGFKISIEKLNNQYQK